MIDAEVRQAVAPLQEAFAAAIEAQVREAVPRLLVEAQTKLDGSPDKALEKDVQAEVREARTELRGLQTRLEVLSSSGMPEQVAQELREDLVRLREELGAKVDPEGARELVEGRLREALAPLTEELGAKIDEDKLNSRAGEIFEMRLREAVPLLTEELGTKIDERLTERIEARMREVVDPLTERPSGEEVTKLVEERVQGAMTLLRESIVELLSGTALKRDVDAQISEVVEAMTRTSANQASLREELVQLASEEAHRGLEELRATQPVTAAQAEAAEARLHETLARLRAELTEELLPQRVEEAVAPLRKELKAQPEAEELQRLVAAQVQEALKPSHPLLSAAAFVLQLLGGGFLAMLALCGVAALPLQRTQR